MIQDSAKIEQNVLPIIKTCIEGTLKASDNVNTSAVSISLDRNSANLYNKRIGCIFGEK